MAYLKDYLQDGADPQARAVMALLSAKDGIEDSWDKERKEYTAKPKIARWENGREQGYIVSLRSLDSKRQINIAFFEHRNSDILCAVMWNQVSFNSITVDTAKFGKKYKDKWDVDFKVSWGKVWQMADWIWNQLEDFWRVK